VTSKFHELHNHVPASQQAVRAAFTFREAPYKALSMLLESPFLLLFHKTNFYRSVALCPQMQAAQKGLCPFTAVPGTYHVPQI